MRVHYGWSKFCSLLDLVVLSLLPKVQDLEGPGALAQSAQWVR